MIGDENFRLRGVLLLSCWFLVMMTLERRRHDSLGQAWIGSHCRGAESRPARF
jgi:hypothetical protein